ncbi:LOW QUALITY PROTEIN: Reverse transcriptase [Phytophthora palmivora]|uniref:Reverse transcriptase n=1 Tax=Phytophthora palmivora TaxID=4796 RepID=A0A2P4Y4Z2_9STRA|nr:LOW QUALITY PROTEIN: Reverse transcriptase [Phytophthora palmivora]
MWLSGDRNLRIPGYVSVGSRRYAEWQNLAYQATTDEISEVDINERITEPAVERHEYVTCDLTTAAIQNVEIAGDGDTSPLSSKCTSDQGKIDSINSDNLRTKIEANIGDPTMDDEVCIKEGGTLFAEDVEDQMAVLPEVTATTEEGNALPPAAKGVVCDIDVGNAKPVAQLPRKVVSTNQGATICSNDPTLDSPWASPIVVIIKKNGIDIRLCIDYCLVNSLTRLMVYPMPLINDLLDDLDKVLWYCSLDMASGFWVVPMTDRARSISAFITPFGLFEWNRMPFGLKNAPQIYQRLLDNALYGFVKVTQDQDRSDRKDVFKTGEPDLARNESVLGRRSYIADILVTGRSCDALCEKVEKLLDACDEWNLSISVAKSFWVRQKVDYLGHRVSAEGLETHPKDLSALQELPFPTNLRSMQSFLGSLNYYSRFIEDFAIYASVLYELRESDFYEITQSTKSIGDDKNVVAEESNKWAEARTAFSILKDKIMTAPILLHFDVDRQPVVVVYASKWAISAALMQEHDGVYKPVTFTSRTLKPNEINYGMVDKEVLALLRILDIFYTQLVTRSIKVLTRHSTLAWLLHPSGLQERLGRWAALLSSWTLEIVKCTKGEDEILGVIAASITPRKEVDSILVSIAPRKQPRQAISMPPQQWSQVNDC